MANRKRKPGRPSNGGRKATLALHVMLTKGEMDNVLAKRDALGLTLRELTIRAIEAYQAPASESARIEGLEARVTRLEQENARRG